MAVLKRYLQGNYRILSSNFTLLFLGVFPLISGYLKGTQGRYGALSTTYRVLYHDLLNSYRVNRVVTEYFLLLAWYFKRCLLGRLLL